MSDSVKKAVKVLHFLADSREGMNLTAISRALNMDKTTTFRYLETLVSVGLVEKKENIYCLGMVLFELGLKVPIKKLVVDKIAPLMKRLCEDINETVNLAQLCHGRLIYLHKIESNRSLQMRSSVGSELPLHCTAIGKSILSILPENESTDIIDNMEFRRFTPSTITEKSKFIDEIEVVKTQGFSLDQEEFEIGLTCIAVPLHIPKQSFYGAISVSAPTLRAIPDIMSQVITKLKVTESEISRLFA